MGFIQKVLNFVVSPTHSRTIGILIIFILVATVGLTVIIAQQQQETRQRASGFDNICMPPYDGYLGCFSLGNFPPDSICTSSCTDPDGTTGQYCYTSTKVGNACVTESNQVGTCNDQGSCIEAPSQTDQSVPTATPILTLAPTEEIILPTVTRTVTEEPTISVPTSTIAPNIPTSSVVPYCYLKNKGDADCDNRITQDDEKIWEQEFISELQGISTQKQSDFNADGSIAIVDFNIWKTGFADSSLPH